MYSAYFLSTIFKKKFARLIVLFTTGIHTASGILNMMAVKNDFRMYVADAPINAFVEWIKTNTSKEAVFVSKKEILDPITFSGRRSYLGHDYYTSVMGYDTARREELVKEFYSMDNDSIVEMMKKEGIQYIVIPKDMKDFPYIVNLQYMQDHLQTVYKEGSLVVFKI